MRRGLGWGCWWDSGGGETTTRLLNLYCEIHDIGSPYRNKTSYKLLMIMIPLLISHQNFFIEVTHKQLKKMTI